MAELVGSLDFDEDVADALVWQVVADAFEALDVFDANRGGQINQRLRGHFVQDVQPRWLLSAIFVSYRTACFFVPSIEYL